MPAAARPAALLHAVRPQAGGPGTPHGGDGHVRSLRLILDELREAGLYRELRTVESAQGPRVLLDGREVLLLCSNDYLGLAGDARLRDAAGEAPARGGAGPGAARLTSGHTTPPEEPEARAGAPQSKPAR